VSVLSGCCSVQAAALKAQTAALLAKSKELAAAVDCDAVMAMANDDEDSYSGESSFLLGAKEMKTACGWCGVCHSLVTVLADAEFFLANVSSSKRQRVVPPVAEEVATEAVIPQDPTTLCPSECQHACIARTTAACTVVRPIRAKPPLFDPRWMRRCL
jgi:hypothetical protein